jgi:hypothetical protein
MNTRRRFIAIMLATVLCLPGCGVPGPIGGLDYIYFEDLSEDAIVIVPTQLTLRVNEKRSIVAYLPRPIAHLVRSRWTVTSSSIALVPGECSDVADGVRECGAVIMAVATGTATITFMAGLDLDDDLLDREAVLQVSVVP